MTTNNKETKYNIHQKHKRQTDKTKPWIDMPWIDRPFMTSSQRKQRGLSLQSWSPKGKFFECTRIYAEIWMV